MVPTVRSPLRRKSFNSASCALVASCCRRLREPPASDMEPMPVDSMINERASTPRMVALMTTSSKVKPPR